MTVSKHGDKRLENGVSNPGLASGDYCVRLIDLPCSVKGFVTYDEEGFPNIYLNARISLNEQKRAMRHELAHISRNDAFSDEEIQNIES